MGSTRVQVGKKRIFSAFESWIKILFITNIFIKNYNNSFVLSNWVQDIPMVKSKLINYLYQIPRTPMIFWHLTIFLPSFWYTGPTNKCFFPVMVTDFQMFNEVGTLVESTWIYISKIAFHIHGFMISINLHIWERNTFVLWYSWK